MTVNILNLISTPVAVLNGTPLTTTIGLSGDDPLSTRHTSEVFRVLVSIYEPGGKFLTRREFDAVGPGERQLLDLSAIVRPEVGDRNTLVVVHRVPESLCSQGEDADRPLPAGANARAFHMYRGMVQYGLPGGGHGSVIYESPLRINDMRGSAVRSRSLMFSSKVLLSGQTETYVCLINYSTDPAFMTAARMTGHLLDAAGVEVCPLATTVGAFQVELVNVRETLARAAGIPAKLTNYSVVMHSPDAATIPLLLQVSMQSRSVSVEHTHAPQAYIQPSFATGVGDIRSHAIDGWLQASQ